MFHIISQDGSQILKQQFEDQEQAQPKMMQQATKSRPYSHRTYRR